MLPQALVNDHLASLPLVLNSTVEALDGVKCSTYAGNEAKVVKEKDAAPSHLLEHMTCY